MRERKRIQQEILQVAPISDVLLPLQDARAILGLDLQTWPIGSMGERELITLYEEGELRTLSFREVVADFLAVMVPHTLKDRNQGGIPFELGGKVSGGLLLPIEPRIIIAEYLIDFTKIINPQKASYKEAVRAIAKAADFLNQNKVPVLENVSMDWHYVLGACFSAARFGPDSSITRKKEAQKFFNTYLAVLPRIKR